MGAGPPLGVALGPVGGSGQGHRCCCTWEAPAPVLPPCPGEALTTPAARPGQPDPELHGRDPALPHGGYLESRSSPGGELPGVGTPAHGPHDTFPGRGSPRVGKHRWLAAEGWPTLTPQQPISSSAGSPAAAPQLSASWPPQAGEHWPSPALCTALGSWTVGLHGRDPALGAQWGLGPRPPYPPGGTQPEEGPHPQACRGHNPRVSSEP